MRKHEAVIGEFFAGFSVKGGGYVSKKGVLYSGLEIIAIKHNRTIDVYDSKISNLIIRVANKLRYKVITH